MCDKIKIFSNYPKHANISFEISSRATLSVSYTIPETFLFQMTRKIKIWPSCEKRLDSEGRLILHSTYFTHRISKHTKLWKRQNAFSPAASWDIKRGTAYSLCEQNAGWVSLP
jgi:hypothetical protein